ncbi:hypothetical protein [Sulfobacillus sp. hq2]|uniref:hypothetical protein n=1 Tax=Sulfobacillus TaxID=28033 RepID=UPI000CD260EE|nr:hypothetical protein [Sulfobacillus sp. hq2]POB12234.1 hypothetical protein CO251_00305 [Sulfobacillus sp. hq2]
MRQRALPFVIAGLCVAVFFYFFPRRTESLTLTRTGPVTHLGESFDAGFIEITVDSVTFEDPQTSSSVVPSVALPAALRVGDTVTAMGQWTANMPWWQTHPAPPEVVTLIAIRRATSR